MSIPGDKWVSSKGTILTCEQLFDALSKRDTDTKLVWLSDYDFQHMYETDLTAQYVRMDGTNCRRTGGAGLRPTS